MGGYGYDQGRQRNKGPSASGSASGNPKAVATLAKTGMEMHAAGVANAANSLAAQAGYQATTAAVGTAATGASTAAGSAAASGAAGAGTGVVAGTTSTSAIATHGAVSLLASFYGGETVSNIKNMKCHNVNVTGGSEGLKTSNLEKTFYKNVKIPKGRC